MLPGAHGVAAVERARHIEPAGQSLHEVAPLEDSYLPASHAAHTLWLSLDVIVPGSHAVAAVLPVAQADPAGHGEQSSCEVAPVASRKDPAAQSRAALAPSVQNDPAGQTSQAVPPSAD